MQFHTVFSCLFNLITALQAPLQAAAGASDKTQLTDFILDLVGDVGNLVEQRQTLVHPLLDHTKVGHHLGLENTQRGCQGQNHTDLFFILTPTRKPFHCKQKLRFVRRI